MKKYGGICAALIAVLAGVLLVSAPQKAVAACANTSSYGAVRLNIPELPRKGDYLLWVRLQGSQSNGRVLVELNGQDCLDVFGSALDADTWTWLPYQSSGQNKTLRFDETDGNSLQLIGVQAGVKVDRVILTKPDCIPEAYGNNCSDTVEAALVNKGDIQQLPSPSNEPVSGKIILSSTPARYQDELKSVSYTVNGRTLQRTVGAEPFDTTLLEDGKYTIIIETELTDGESIRESTVIEIDNPTNPFSPVMRWFRLHQRSIAMIAGIIAAVVGTILLLAMLRRWYLRRRERHFHGF